MNDSVSVEPSRLDWLAPTRDPHPARDAGFRSYAAVIAGDKAAWLANFAEDGVIQDPVGKSMFDEVGLGHRTPEERAHFWDITIGTMDRFVFEIRSSYASGDECANVGTIHTTLANGWTASTEGVFVYRVDEDGRIASLKAYWELDQVMASTKPPADAS